MKPKPRASHGPQGREGGHDGDAERVQRYTDRMIHVPKATS